MSAYENKPCPFCGASVRGYDGDYVLSHARDCFFSQHYSQETWIIGAKMLKRWNERADQKKHKS